MSMQRATDSSIGPYAPPSAAVAETDARGRRAPLASSPRMETRVTAITLGVRDVAASRRFYVEGLGWPTLFDEEDIFFIQVAAGQMLALWNVASMPREYGDVALPEAGASGIPISLGRNVESEEAVDREVARAIEAGATLVAAPARQVWGGYSGCFADPDGYRWDVVFNPGLRVDPDGTLHLVAVD